MSLYEVTVNCRNCGQTLIVAARNLGDSFTCPRCGANERAAAMVDTATPLRAIPASNPDASTTVALSMTMPLAVYRPGQPEREEQVGAPAPTGAALTPITASQDPVAPGSPEEQAEEAALPTGRNTAWTKLVTAVGRGAWWLDRATHGWQLAFLIATSALVWIAQRFAQGVYTGTLLVYSVALYLLLVSRLWWIREEDGTWSWHRFATRSSAAVNEYFRGFATVAEFSWANVLDQSKMVFIAVGSMLVVTGPPALACSSYVLDLAGSTTESSLLDLMRTLEPLGWGLLAVGTAFALLRYLQQRSPEATTFAQAAAALRDRSELPFVIDVWESRYGSALPRELRVLVETLAKWQPRGRKNEAGYEASLERFLLKELPGVRLSRQVDVASASGVPIGRLDIVVEEMLAIELKQELRLAAHADRAVGQIGKYAAAWTKGPVLLLICETHAGFEQSPFIERLAELRQLGRAVFVVAAGRRLA